MRGKEVGDEAREARDAGDAGLLDPEGGLRERGGRARRVGGRPPGSTAVRLKLSVEIFAASDGALYLLRLGAGEEFVLRAPRPQDRHLIELLGQGYRTASELARGLGARNLPVAEIAESLAALDAAGLLEHQHRGAPSPLRWQNATTAS